MFQLNENDLLCLKYMILSTGQLNRDDLIKIQDVTALFDKLRKSNGDVDSGDIENECLYYLKCYHLLHINGSCPAKYVAKNWGENVPDESVLLVRLFQNLSTEDFFDVLQTCVGVSEAEFRDLQMDFNKLDIGRYLPEIEEWLQNKGDPFVNDVRGLIRERSSGPDNLSAKDIKGICLIINNENFNDSEKHLRRQGTDKDEERITQTFSKLGFEVRIERDVFSYQMNGILEDTKSDIIFNHKMFVAFFLSHGIRDKLITSDDKEYPFEDIWKLFSGSQCPILIGKPKLFFFVCCQGHHFNRAVPELESDGIRLEIDGNPRIHPDISDFFFGYATFKRFRAFRHTIEGTFYIKYLCAEIDATPTRSISDIHIEVQRKLTERPITEHFQMPYFESLLRGPCCLG